MYKDIQERFWWHGMKRDIATSIACCDSCQRIKAEHQRPAGLLQPNKIPEWKWDEIGMDFIVGLPRSRHGNDAIWVITDRLTKVAHFIPVKTTYNTQKLARIYLSHIVCPYSLSAWSPEDYNIRQRHSICLEILGSFTTGSGNSIGLQHSLSSPD